MKIWMGIALTMMLGVANGWAASSLDSAGYHIKAGASYIAQGRNADALKEFDAAIARDGKSFDAWAGKAEVLLSLKQGDAMAKAVDTIKDLEDNKAQKAVWLRIALKYQQAFKPDGWFPEAKKLFFQARKITPKNSELQLWVARSYRDNGKTRMAEKHYAKAVQFGGESADAATTELRAMHRKATAGGTGKGVAGELALKTQVDRASLAALVMEQLSMRKLFAKRAQRVALPADAKASPYAASIEALLNLQLNFLEVDGRGDFRPNQPVRRIELARMIEQYLAAVTKDANLHRAFIGTKSPFPDLSSSNYAFNAAFLAVSRGLIQPLDVRSGRFDGDKPVSGVDLLLVLRKLGSLSVTE